MGPKQTGLLTGRGLFTRESESSTRCSWPAGRNVYVPCRGPAGPARTRERGPSPANRRNPCPIAKYKNARWLLPSGVFVNWVTCWDYGRLFKLTNLAALRLKKEDRLYSPLFAWGGLVGCLFLAFWVDWQIWLTGLGLIAVGLLWHTTRRHIANSSL